MIIENKSADEIMQEMIKYHPNLPAVLTRVAGRVEITKRAISEYQAAVLYALVKAHAPKRILEIGTAQGYSAAMMAEAAPDAEIITLNPRADEIEVAQKGLQYYPNVEIVQALSWDYLLELNQEDGFDLFDFIFVDGDHKRVLKDMAWWDNLKEGGVMFFHDYSPEGTYRACPPVVEGVDHFAAVVGRPPDIAIIDDGGVGMVGFVKKEGDLGLVFTMKGALLRAYTQSHCTLNYLRHLYLMAEGVKRKHGAIVEVGVTNGGSAAVLANGASRAGREVWLIDTFEGMPEPDRDIDGMKAYRKWSAGEWCAPYSGETAYYLVEELDEKAEIEVVNVNICEDELPPIPEKVLILHVDATLYRSTLEALRVFHDRVVEDGLIIVGAYGHWPGVKQAVDEFRQEKKITGDMEPVDGKGVVWRKTAP